MTDEELKAEYDKRRLVSPVHAECIAEKLARADAYGRAEKAEAEVRRAQNERANIIETLNAATVAYETLERRHSDVCARYEAEVRRLRELIKKAEMADDDNCPWCLAWRKHQGKTSADMNEPHEPNCPAFTPDGDVR